MDHVHDGETSHDDGENHLDYVDNDDVNADIHHLDDFDRSQPLSGDGASPGKIFIGGLARETTTAQFVKYFGQYGEITDSVIMKDRKTGHPRGFGFVTYADPSVVDKVIEETHIINGKQVEIKRTIPKGAAGSKDLKTKKIFVGGIPTNVTEDEFKEFFNQFGEVKEHQIMRDHSTNRSRGFGFITFESEQVVDDLLDKGNRIDLAGVQVEIKKAEPKRPNPPPAPSKRYSDSRNSYGGGFRDSYGGYGGGRGGDYGGYRSGGAYSGRAGGYGGYGAGDYGGYGVYGGGSGMGPYSGDPSMAYVGRYGGGYGEGMNRGYDFGGGNYGGPGESYGGYGSGGGAGGGYGGGSGYGGGGGGGGGYGSGGYGSGGYGSGGGYSGGGGYGGGGYGAGSFDTGFGGGYGAGAGAGAGSGGGAGGSGFYGSRGGYGGAGSGRYHPYGR